MKLSLVIAKNIIKIPGIGNDILILNINEKDKYDIEKINSKVLFYDTKENIEALCM